MQSRVIEIVDEGNGHLSIYVTNLDHNSPTDSLAHRGRELAAAKRAFGSPTEKGDVQGLWQRDLPAQNLLALKYYYGGDVFGPQAGWTQDYTRAFKIWQRSAKKGVEPSQFMLGVMYMLGQGVDSDYAEAHAWFNLALSGGYKLATDSLMELSHKISADEKRQGQQRLQQLREELADVN